MEEQKMKTEDLIQNFKKEPRPIASAAAFLGVHENTIRAWINKDGNVPAQWAALFEIKTRKEVVEL
jgi:uncharacterized protein YjcR